MGDGTKGEPLGLKKQLVEPVAKRKSSRMKSKNIKHCSTRKKPLISRLSPRSETQRDILAKSSADAKQS